MKREIKFRAWATNVSYPKGYMATQGEPDLETLQSFMFHYADEERLMQFTGLKDKNGKDVFQDDLAMINNELCVVNFDAYFICGWEFKSIKNGSYPFNSTCTNFNNTGCSDFEIIGNIYENPNLLTQNQ